jgi:hypothetical protein
VVKTCKANGVDVHRYRVASLKALAYDRTGDDYDYDALIGFDEITGC